MPQFDDTAQDKKIAELRRKEEGGLIRALSKKYGHQYVDLNGVTINTEALRLIDEEHARKSETAIFEKVNKKLSVAIRNPNNKESTDMIESLRDRGFLVTVFMTPTASLEHAWERYGDIKQATASQKGVLDIASEEVERLAHTITKSEDIAHLIKEIAAKKSTGHVSETLEAILGGALALRASDIHLEPEDNDVRLRLRLDGVLWDIIDIDHNTHKLLRSRLKLLSGLKLNVTDRAQDGRFTIDVGEKDLEIRLSAIPGAYGESIVMRILDPSSISRAISDLGINEHLLRVIEEEIARPTGMILTTGPTGSGKTTTLYAFLKRIHTPEIKIITIEDPIEYHLEGVVQTQTNNDYNFADGLRAILRQDPDVIMVGEIRDRDVAETAANAALTGHLVFSTLHANSAAGAFPRLVDLGIDTQTIGSAINLVLAQRLVRVLCEMCKKEHTITAKERDLMTQVIRGHPSELVFDEHTSLYEPVGCDACGNSGFKGRVGVYEGIRVDTKIETILAHDLSEEAVLEGVQTQKIPTMQQDGMARVLSGVTSLDELKRVIDLSAEKLGMLAHE